MVDGAGSISEPQEIAHDAAVGRRATARVSSSIGEIEAEWRDLQDRGVCGPAQSFDWVAHWQRHVNDDCIAVVLSVDQRPVLLLPLEIVATRLCRMARFPGGSHANCNFPVLARDYPVDATSIGMVVEAIRRERPDIDLISLDRQLAVLDGVDNPLLALDNRESTNIALAAPLAEGFDAVLAHHNPRRRRKKHRQHAKRYEDAGGWRIVRATDAKTATAFLDRFFTIKAERFAAAGIHDVFADPEIQAFLRSLYGDDAEAKTGSFVIEALEVDGRIIAVNAMSSWKKTMTIEFSGFDTNDTFSTSPGEFMFYESVEAACGTDTRLFSFGVGDEPYKREWCAEEIVLYDCSVALSAKGTVCSRLTAAEESAKRFVKRNPRLWAAAKAVRAHLPS